MLLEIPTFKCRCSAIGNIMAGRIGLTEIQENKLHELQTKPKLTEKQGLELENLLYKKENPELPQGCKTYVLGWLKGKIFERQKQVTSLAIEKGNVMEDESIDFIAKMLGYPVLVKNSKFYSNEYLIGTPDILPGTLVIDAKNSWSWETFPLLEDEPPIEGYIYQLQGYMDLTGTESAKLCYVLSDTPEHLIVSKATKWCYDNGYEGLMPDIYKTFCDNLRYFDVDDEFKFRCFDIPRDNGIIEDIHKRVLMCRAFLEDFVQKKYKDKITFVNESKDDFIEHMKTYNNDTQATLFE